MKGCVNRSHVGFKRLSSVYGDKVAESLVRIYSEVVKGLTDDFYYPTITEAKNWLTEMKDGIADNVTTALKLDPTMPVSGIKGFLKGVIHDYKGTTLLTAGPFGMGVINNEVRDTIYLPNLKIMQELERRHPEIFKIKYTKSPHTKIIEITPLEEGRQGRLFQKPGMTETAKTSEKTLEAIKDFIHRIGVDIKTLRKIKVNGVEYDANGVAEIMQKIIQVVEGKEAITLPEEAMHFVVEIIKQKNPNLYKKLFNSIGSYRMTQMVFTDYGNDPNYKTKDGKPDVIKLKEEAMAKVLANAVIKRQEEVIENPELLEKVNSWWKAVIEFFKNLIFRSGFDKLAMDIVAGRFEGTADDIKGEEERAFFQLGSQESLFNSLKEIAGKIELKEDPATGEGTYYIGAKKIARRVTSIAKTWLDKIFAEKALLKGEYQKAVDDMKAEKGTAGHSAFNYAFSKFIDENGYLRDITIEEIDESDYAEKNPNFDWEQYEILRDNLYERLHSLDNDRDNGRTRFLSEITVYDKKRDVAGTIDFLAIKPNGKVSIYDWKFMDLNIERYEDVPWYKINAWNKQMVQYKIILQDAYGVKSENFEHTRMIPILARYTEGDPKNRILPRLSEVIIGDVDVKKIENMYLLPVGLETEKTGKAKVDELVEKLNAIYQKMSEKKVSPEEKKEKADQLNKLFTAIRQLHIKGDIIPLIEQAQFFNRLAVKTIEKFERDFVGKSPKGFTDKQMNSFAEELMDMIEAINKYTLLDVELESLFPAETTADDEKVLDALSKAADKARRMEIKLNDTLRNFTADFISKSENVDDFLSPEKVIKGISRAFISTAGLQLRSIEVLYKKANKAFAHAAFDTQSESKVLNELRVAYEKWAKGKGLSLKDYFDIIKKKESNELIDEFDSEFYKKLKEKTYTKEVEWIIKNVDIPAYRQYLQEKVVEEKERARNKNRLAVGEEAEREIEREFVNIDRLYDTETTDSLGWLLYEEIKKFPKRELWESKEWKELIKPENKPAKDFYDYIIKKNQEYRDIGYITNARTFLPFVRKNLVEKLIMGGNPKLMESFFRQISVDEGDIGYGHIDPLSGKPMNVIPKYFTREIDGEVSTDLFHTMALYNEAALKYKYVTDIEDQVRALVAVEETKKAIATSMFGKTEYKDGVLQYSKDNTQNSKLVEDMMKAIVYGQRFIQSETFDQLLFKLGTWGDKINKKLGIDIFPENLSKRQVSVNKLLNNFNNMFQLNVLGLNLLSGSSNFFGGNMQSIINAGVYYTRADYIAAEGLIFMNKFKGVDKRKAVGALEYFLPFTDNYNRELAKKLSLSSLTQESLQDFLMILMRKSDWAVQMSNFYAYINNTIVLNGKLVNAREYLRTLPEYQEKYNGTPEQRGAFEDKFDEDVKKLIDEKGVLKLAKIENNEFIIPDVDRHDESVIELRRKVQQLSKDALGNLSEDDLRMINMQILGKSAMIFKNWIPRPMDVRLGNLKYNAASDAYEWGRIRTVMRIVVDEGLFKGLNRLYDSLTANEKGIEYLKELYERKKADYEKDTNKTLNVTETQFIDMVRLNIKNQMVDVLAMVSLSMLLWGLKAAMPDDDDESEAVKNQYRLMVRMADKFRTELSYFYDPTNVISALSTGIFPSMSLIDNFRKFVKNFLKENWALATGDTEKAEDTYVIKYLMRSFPFTNQMAGYLPMFYPELAKDLGIRMQSNYSLIRK